MNIKIMNIKINNHSSKIYESFLEIDISLLLLQRAELFRIATIGKYSPVET